MIARLKLIFWSFAVLSFIGFCTFLYTITKNIIIILVGLAFIAGIGVILYHKYK